MGANSIKRFVKNFKIAVLGRETSFTTGSINRAIFMLAVPMILEMVMESLFAVVDVFFVSRVNVNAVATVGLTESIMFIVYSIAIGLSMAATAMVSRRIGEKDPKRAANAAFQSILIGVSFSIIISVVGLIYPKQLLELMGGEADLIEEGYGYTQIILGGNVTILLLFLINAIFRGAGNASLAMRALWTANILNMILDPIFIFGWGPFPEMGVAGAAVATTIGRGTGVLVQLYLLLKGSSVIKVTAENLVVRWKTISSLLKIGFGGMGQFLIESASWIFLVRIIALFGSEALAGYTISFRIIVFTLLPAWGLSNAAATLVGQNLGAKQPERAEKSVWRTALYNMIFLLILSIIFFTWSDSFVGIFSQEEQVLYYGNLALKIICLGYVFFAYGMVVSQSFNGAGDTRTPTLVNFFTHWMIQIPLAYWLAVSLDLGPTGVFWAIDIAFSLMAIISIILFRRGRWKLVQV